ncbi:lonely Cys domain-containing protein [Streptomyces sp. NPDC004976]
MPPSLEDSPEAAELLDNAGTDRALVLGPATTPHGPEHPVRTAVELTRQTPGSPVLVRPITDPLTASFPGADVLLPLSGAFGATSVPAEPRPISGAAQTHDSKPVVTAPAVPPKALSTTTPPPAHGDTARPPSTSTAMPAESPAPKIATMSRAEGESPGTTAPPPEPNPSVPHEEPPSAPAFVHQGWFSSHAPDEIPPADALPSAPPEEAQDAHPTGSSSDSAMAEDPYLQLLTDMMGPGIEKDPEYPAIRDAIARLDQLRQADPALRDGPLDLEALARRVLLLQPDEDVDEVAYDTLIDLVMNPEAQPAAGPAALAALRLQKVLFSSSLEIIREGKVQGRNWTALPFSDADLTRAGREVRLPDGTSGHDVVTAPWKTPAGPDPYVIRAIGDETGVLLPDPDNVGRYTPLDVFAELLALDPTLSALSPDIPVVLVVDNAGGRGLDLPRRVADRIGRNVWSANGELSVGPLGPSPQPIVSLVEKEDQPRPDWILSTPGQVLDPAEHENAPAWESRMLTYTIVSDDGRSAGRGMFDPSEARKLTIAMRAALQMKEVYHIDARTGKWFKDQRELPFAGKPFYIFGAHGIPGSTVLPTDNDQNHFTQRQTGGVLKRRPSLSQLPEDHSILLLSCWSAAPPGVVRVWADRKVVSVHDPLGTPSEAEDIANETGRTVYAPTHPVGVPVLQDGTPVCVMHTDARGATGTWLEIRPWPKGDLLDNRAREAGLHTGPGPVSEVTRERTLRLVRALRWTFGVTVEDNNEYGDLLAGIGALELMRSADPALGDLGPFSVNLLVRVALEFRARAHGAKDGNLNHDTYRDLLTKASQVAHQHPGTTLTSFVKLPLVRTAASLLSRLTPSQRDALVATTLFWDGTPPTIGEPERTRMFWASVRALEWRSQVVDLNSRAQQLLHLDGPPDPARLNELHVLVMRAAAAGVDLRSDLELGAFHLETMGALSKQTLLLDEKGAPAGRDWLRSGSNLPTKVVTDRVAVAIPQGDGYQVTGTQTPPWKNGYLVWGQGDEHSMFMKLPGGFSGRVPYAHIGLLLAWDPVLNHPSRRDSTPIVLALSHANPTAPTGISDKPPKLISVHARRVVWGSQGRVQRFMEGTKQAYIPGLIRSAPGHNVADDWLTFNKGTREIPPVPTGATSGFLAGQTTSDLALSTEPEPTPPPDHPQRDSITEPTPPEAHQHPPTGIDALLEPEPKPTPTPDPTPPTEPEPEREPEPTPEPPPVPKIVLTSPEGEVTEAEEANEPEPGQERATAPAAGAVRRPGPSPWYFDHGAMGQVIVSKSVETVDFTRDRADFWARQISSRLDLQGPGSNTALRSGVEKALRDLLLTTDPKKWDDILAAGRTLVVEGRLVWLRPVLTGLTGIPTPKEDVTRFPVGFGSTATGGQSEHEESVGADTALFTLFNLGTNLFASAAGLVVPQIKMGSSQSRSRGWLRTVLSGRKPFINDLSRFRAGLRMQVFVDGMDATPTAFHQVTVPDRVHVDVPTVYTGQDGQRPDEQAPVANRPSPERTSPPSQARELLQAVNLTPVIAALHRNMLAAGLPAPVVRKILIQAKMDRTEGFLSESTARNRYPWWAGGDSSNAIQVNGPLIKNFRGHLRIRREIDSLQYLGDSKVGTRDDIGAGNSNIGDRKGGTDGGLGVGYNSAGVHGGDAGGGSAFKSHAEGDDKSVKLTGLVPVVNFSLDLKRNAGYSLDTSNLSHTVLNDFSAQSRYRAVLRIRLDMESSTHKIAPVDVTTVGEVSVPQREAATFVKQTVGQGWTSDLRLVSGGVNAPRHQVPSLAKPRRIRRLPTSLPPFRFHMVVDGAKRLLTPHPREPLALAARKGLGFGVPIALPGTESLQQDVRDAIEQHHIKEVGAEKAARSDWSTADRDLAAFYGRPALEADLSQALLGIYRTIEVGGRRYKVAAKAVWGTRVNEPSPMADPVGAGDPGATGENFHMRVNTRAVASAKTAASRSRSWEFGVAGGGGARLAIPEFDISLGRLHFTTPPVRFQFGAVQGVWRKGKERGDKLSGASGSYRRTETSSKVDEHRYLMGMQWTVTPDGRKPRYLSGRVPIVARVVVPEEHIPRQPVTLEQTRALQQTGVREVTALPESSELDFSGGAQGIYPVFHLMPELARLGARMYAEQKFSGEKDPARRRRLIDAWLSNPADWPKEIRDLAHPTILASHFGDSVRGWGHELELPKDGNVKQALRLKIHAYTPEDLGASPMVEVEQYAKADMEHADEEDGDYGTGVTASVGPQLRFGSDASHDEHPKGPGGRLDLVGHASLINKQGSGRSSSAGRIDITRATYGGPVHTVRTEPVFELTYIRWRNDTLTETTRYLSARDALDLLVPERRLTDLLPTTGDIAEEGNEATPPGTQPQQETEPATPPGTQPQQETEPATPRTYLDTGLLPGVSHPEIMRADAVLDAINARLQARKVIPTEDPTATAPRPNLLQRSLKASYSSDALQTEWHALTNKGVFRWFPMPGPWGTTRYLWVNVTATRIDAPTSRRFRDGTKLTLRGEAVNSEESESHSGLAFSGGGDVRARAGNETGHGGIEAGVEYSDASKTTDKDTRKTVEIHRVNTQDSSQEFEHNVTFRVDMGMSTELPALLTMRSRTVNRIERMVSGGADPARGRRLFVWRDPGDRPEQLLSGSVRLLVPQHLTHETDRPEQWPLDLTAPLETQVEWQPRPGTDPQRPGPPVAPTVPALPDAFLDGLHPWTVPAATSIERWGKLTAVRHRRAPDTQVGNPPTVEGLDPTNSVAGVVYAHYAGSAMMRPRVKDLLQHTYKLPIGDRHALVGLELDGADILGPVDGTLVKQRRYRQRDDAPEHETEEGSGWSFIFGPEAGGHVADDRLFGRLPFEIKSWMDGQSRSSELGDTDERNAEGKRPYRVYRFEVTAVVHGPFGTVRIKVPGGLYGMLPVDKATGRLADGLEDDPLLGHLLRPTTEPENTSPEETAPRDTRPQDPVSAEEPRLTDMPAEEPVEVTTPESTMPRTPASQDEPAEPATAPLRSRPETEAPAPLTEPAPPKAPPSEPPPPPTAHPATPTDRSLPHPPRETEADKPSTTSIAQQVAADDLPDSPPRLDDDDTVTPPELEDAGLLTKGRNVQAQLNGDRLTVRESQLTPIEHVRLLMLRPGPWSPELQAIADTTTQRLRPADPAITPPTPHEPHGPHDTSRPVSSSDPTPHGRPSAQPANPDAIEEVEAFSPPAEVSSPVRTRLLESSSSVRTPLTESPSSPRTASAESSETGHKPAPGVRTESTDPVSGFRLEDTDPVPGVEARVREAGVEGDMVDPVTEAAHEALRKYVEGLDGLKADRDGEAVDPVPGMTLSADPNAIEVVTGAPDGSTTGHAPPPSSKGWDPELLAQVNSLLRRTGREPVAADAVAAAFESLDAWRRARVTRELAEDITYTLADLKLPGLRGGEPQRVTLHSYVHESEWWTLYIDPKNHEEAQAAFPDDPGSYYDHDQSPGFQGGMVAAYTRFLGDPNMVGRPMDASSYRIMHRLATSYLGRDLDWSGGPPTHFPLRAETLTDDVFQEMVGDQRLVYDMTTHDWSKGRIQLQPVTILTRFIYNNPTLSTNYRKSETPGLVDAVFRQHYERIAEARGDVGARLASIVRTIRALHLIHPFQDGNLRTNVQILLPKLLLEQNFRPVVPNDMYSLFQGGRSVQEMVASLVRDGVLDVMPWHTAVVVPDMFSAHIAPTAFHPAPPLSAERSVDLRESELLDSRAFWNGQDDVRTPPDRAEKSSSRPPMLPSPLAVHAASPGTSLPAQATLTDTNTTTGNGPKPPGPHVGSQAFVAQQVAADDLPENPPRLDDGDTVTRSELKDAGLLTTERNVQAQLTGDRLTVGDSRLAPFEHVRLLMLRSGPWSPELQAIADTTTQRLRPAGPAVSPPASHGSHDTSRPVSTSAPTPHGRPSDRPADPDAIEVVEASTDDTAGNVPPGEGRGWDSELLSEVNRHLGASASEVAAAFEQLPKWRQNRPTRYVGEDIANLLMGQEPGGLRGGAPDSDDSGQMTMAQDSQQAWQFGMTVLGDLGAREGRFLPDGQLDYDGIFRKVLLLNDIEAIIDDAKWYVVQAVTTMNEQPADLADIALHYGHIMGLLPGKGDLYGVNGQRSGYDYTGMYPQSRVDMERTGIRNLKGQKKEIARPWSTSSFAVTASWHQDGKRIVIDILGRDVPIDEDLFVKLIVRHSGKPLAAEPVLLMLHAGPTVTLARKLAHEFSLAENRWVTSWHTDGMWTFESLNGNNIVHPLLTPRGAKEIVGDWLPNYANQIPDPNATFMTIDGREIPDSMVKSYGLASGAEQSGRVFESVSPRHEFGYRAAPRFDQIRAEKKGTLKLGPLHPLGFTFDYMAVAHSDGSRVMVPLTNEEDVWMEPEEWGKFLARRNSLKSKGPHARVLAVSCELASPQDGWDSLEGMTAAQRVDNELKNPVIASERKIGVDSTLPYFLDVVDDLADKPRIREFAPARDQARLADLADRGGLHQNLPDREERAFRWVMALRRIYGATVDTDPNWSALFKSRIRAFGRLEQERITAPDSIDRGPLTWPVLEQTIRSHAIAHGWDPDDVFEDTFERVMDTL